jgi:hypothetical protein
MYNDAHAYSHMHLLVLFPPLRTLRGTPQTVLVELNDGFSLGLYPGCPAAWYAEMQVARWQELVSSGPCSGRE